MWELTKKLEKKGYNSQEISQALAESQRLGYQSDERFAELLCRSRITQGYGPVRIKQELAAKGIVAETIQHVLEQEEAHRWLERAREVLRKKCRSFATLSWEEQQKLKRFLLYRGFPVGVIAGIFEQN